MRHSSIGAGTLAGAILVPFLLLVTVSCGGTGTGIDKNNNPPVANAGPDMSATVGEMVHLNGGGTDQDGDQLTYTWTMTSMPQGCSATVGNANQAAATFVPDMGGQYVFTLSVSDGKATQSDQCTLTVNNPPAVDAGADQSVSVGQLVHLAGTATDTDGDALTYTWAFASKPGASTAALSGASSAAASFTPDVGGQYVLSFTANDGKVARSDQCTVTANSAPTADAGPNQSVNVGDAVLLNGTGSSDPDGDNLFYTWSLPTRPAGSAATLVNPTSATPSFTADVAGTYIARLVVSDGKASSAPDQVTITATAVNTPPTADAGPDQSVNVGDAVLLDGTGSFDPDGDNLTYSWSLPTRPAGSAATLVNPTSATPSFTADVGGSYVAQLVVNDGKASSAPDQVTITAAQAQTPLYLRYESPDDYLSNQAATSGYVTLTYYYSGTPVTVEWPAVLGNGISGTAYGFSLWLHGGITAGQTGTFEANILVDHGGARTTLASHTFTVPFSSVYVEYEVDVTGIPGGVAGDQIILAVTFSGAPQGHVRYGISPVDSHILVPGTVTVTRVPSPPRIIAGGESSVKTVVSSDQDLTHWRR